MALLLTLLFLFEPFSTAGRFLDGKLVTPGLVVAMVVAAIAAQSVVQGRYRTIARLDRWILAFCLFLLVALLSILISPYLVEIWLKGSTQLVGLIIMLLSAVAIISEVRRRPVLFREYVGLSCGVLGLVALIGVIQFVIANVTGHMGIFDFSFLNRLADGTVWWKAERMGLIRANSFVQEPAFFSVILGLGGGVSVIRLGLLGRRYRHRLQGVIPLWAALCIVGGFIVAFSLVGYLLLGSVMLSVWFASRRVRIKTLLGALTLACIFTSILYLGIGRVLPSLRQKVQSIALITDPTGIQHKDGAVSALAIVVNLRVMLSNLRADPLLGAGLGAQPIAFDDQNPGLGMLNWHNLDVNKEDGASLLIRLLSESGVIGAALFITGWIMVILRGRWAVLTSLEAHGVTVHNALATGVVASLAGVGLACLCRAPQYYALWFWLPMALGGCVTSVLEWETKTIAYDTSPEQ